MPVRILVIEKGSSLTRLMRRNFEAAGYKVSAAERENELKSCLCEGMPDLVVLEPTLYGAVDVEACAQNLIGGDEPSKPVAPEANDFAAPILSMRELLERVGELTHLAKSTGGASVLRVGDLELNRDYHRVMRSGKVVELRLTEFRLLEFLMQKPGQVFSREQLVESVWAAIPNVDVRTVDFHISRLRRALKMRNKVDLLRTVVGVGYTLAEGEDSGPPPLKARRPTAARKAASGSQKYQTRPSHETDDAMTEPVASAAIRELPEGCRLSRAKGS